MNSKKKREVLPVAEEWPKRILLLNFKRMTDGTIGSIEKVPGSAIG